MDRVDPRTLADYHSAIPGFMAATRPDRVGVCWATALALLCVSACARVDHAARPDVIVVVIDTLRADRLGALGGRGRSTPFLDELAARGTLFTRAHAVSPWTCPSVAALLTSRYPSQLRIADFDSRIPDTEISVVERFAAAGYRTLGFSGNLRLTRALGYGQGFTVWGPALLPHSAKPSSDRLTQKLFRQLDRHRRRGVRAPVLAYIQPMEPHSPYGQHDAAVRARLGLPAARVRELNGRLDAFRWDTLTAEDRRDLEALYDGEVAAIDARLRRLFDGLRMRGLLDHAVVVVTADHGEEFDDHGMFMHGTSLFEELIHVPLLVLRPGDTGGRRVETPVSLLDVAPTLLELVGLPAEPRFEGRSLRAWLDGAPAGAGPVRAELLPAPGFLLGRHSLAVVEGPLKLIVARPAGILREQPLLFDLATDPGEHHPNPAALAQRALRVYRSARREQRALLARGRDAGERGEVTPAMRERLRALGYVN